MIQDYGANVIVNLIYYNHPTPPPPPPRPPGQTSAVWGSAIVSDVTSGYESI